MENLTFVCLNCQKAFCLRAGSMRPVCPFCAANLHRVNHVPPRSKSKEWAALRRQIFRRETSLEREKVARTNELLLREYKLERQREGGQTSRRLKKAAKKMQQHSKKLNSSLEKLL